MGRPPGSKNGQGRKAAAKKAASKAPPPENQQFNDQGTPPPKTNVPPSVIAQALTEMLEFDRQMASIAGLKGAAINRYEAQGIDRELLAGLNKLARKEPDQAIAYITGLTQYATAAEVIPPPADDKWVTSVKQAELFQPATGEIAENLRMARAKRQGIQAGKKGHLLDSNPYRAKPGSPEFVGWRDGHGEGLELRKQIKPGSENVQQAPDGEGARRGRRATGSDEPAKTQLQKDEETYRAKAGGDLRDMPPASELPQ